jgi:hypothetical protein
MLAMLALLLAAQEVRGSSPPQDEQIIVTAPSAIEVRQARRHVNAIGQTIEGQIARFRAPVCPLAIGLRRAEAAFFVERIRVVAAEAGIPTAPAGCRANLVVIMAQDAHRLVNELYRQRPAIFARLPNPELRRVLRGDDPVRIWRTTEILNEDGFTVNPVTGILTVRSASIISAPTQQATVQAVVVIDQNAANGNSFGQLADYVAMRAVGGAREPRGGAEAGATILTLFRAPAEAPPELTELDRSYLTALYRSRPDQSSMQQMSQISRLMADRAARARGAGSQGR